ncbi:Ig-like domain-containing protein [Pontibacter vulgaris]|uniref:Ig-like domain-containing protein n=1 Tax=Pontibacter vulgaris TaxID=2905679 RepID=UPI00266DD6BC|nr:Ig-like domain-containing protein [Pontibacter vulgaris]
MKTNFYARHFGESSVYTLIEQYNAHPSSPACHSGRSHYVILPKAYTLYLLLFWLSCLLFSPLVYAQPPAGFSDQQVGSDWNAAVGLTFSKDGKRMYVWEKAGKVWIVENGTKKLLLDISPEVGDWKDHGLVGFALHPNFEQNGYLYLLYIVDRHHLMNFGKSSYSATTDEYFAATIGRLTRYTARSGDNFTSVDPASRKILLGESPSTGVAITAGGHGVGTLAFASDGTLLVSTGDGAVNSSTDVGSLSISYYQQALNDGILKPKENVGAYRAQLVDCLNGKLLRLDPATGNGVPSNPYYDANNPRAPKSRVWALGFRNGFRFSVKPGTGSTNPADGRPGTIYIGDVGWNTWEELDVITGPRMNFGWPVFEGMEAQTLYSTKKIANRDAPNPLYNSGGCTQQYFYFTDLIRQATLVTNPTLQNPCNTSQTIPSSIPTFVHVRPTIDWQDADGGIARVGTYSGTTATVATIGTPESGVTGTPFRGNSSTGGVWYTGTMFPAAYQNTYFHGDYGQGWIKNFVLDSNHKMKEVRNFINNDAIVVHFEMHPTDGSLYYINYAAQIRRITYGGNQPPVAVASSNKTYGPSPLAVTFSSSGSKDPEGGAITYSWNFGDGSTASTAANPSHTFAGTTGVPKRYDVKLTVKDNKGATGTTTLPIYVNNTPPSINITSPSADFRYSTAGNTTIGLKATVTDKEHADSELEYKWQVVMHHNTHTHPEEPVYARETTVTVAPEGDCNDGETYWARIHLTVTDALGLANTSYVDVYPDCAASSTSFYRAINLNGDPVLLDGKQWGGKAATNYTFSGSSAVNTTTTLTPTTDADRTAMIRSFIYSRSARVTLTAVPQAQYQVYLYVWEDNNPETYSIALNGQQVLDNYNSGSAGTWKKLGPWNTTVGTGGSISVTTTGGMANLSGIEVWKVESGTTNKAPTVSITAPTAGATLTQGSATTISATASDPDGTVSKVEFFANGSKLGEDVTSPYSISWTPGTSGNVSLTARATDNSGATTTSATIGVTVQTGTTTPGTFYRAINLNGSAITIDNNSWGGSTSANYTFNGNSFSNQAVTLNPTTDANRATMIRSSIYSSSARVTLTSVPNGTYNVYLYVWEDNNAQTFSVSLNGSVVQSNYNSGAAGTWKKLGPWTTTISNGSINVTTSGGTANLSGIEVWNAGSTPPPTDNCTASGTIVREIWTGISGSSISSIPVNSAPNSTLELTSLASPLHVGDNYGSRMRGYLCAPATGNYTFWAAGDNTVEVWISTDASPANKRRIIAFTGSTLSREWTKYPEQQSGLVALEANKRYYIEVLHKEATGGDHVAVGWRMPNGTLERPIGGNRISPYEQTATSNAAITGLQTPEEKSLLLYPNPFQDKLHIDYLAKESGTAQFILYNNTGAVVRQVYSGKVVKGQHYTFEADTRALPNGIYFGRVITGSATVNSKVVLAR